MQQKKLTRNDIPSGSYGIREKEERGGKEKGKRSGKKEEKERNAKGKWKKI